MPRAPRTADVQPAAGGARFEDFFLRPETLAGLRAAGFVAPTPVQQAAIPLALLGCDVLARAKAGTGKTCCFVAAALQAVDPARRAGPQSLVLAPTREVAVQICDVARALGGGIAGLRAAAFIGGLPVEADLEALRDGVAVAAGTPGRVRSLLESAAMPAAAIRVLVLDEADHLMLPAFRADVRAVAALLPPRRQVLAFSATFPSQMKAELLGLMRSPAEVDVVGAAPATPIGVSHSLAALAAPDTVARRAAAAHEVLARAPFQQAVVFCASAARGERAARELCARGWPAAFIAGALAQPERLRSLARLRSADARVLVSTDVTARGVDVEGVDLVVHLDAPRDRETFLHRVGRAGRYGGQGRSVGLLGSLSDEESWWAEVGGLPDGGASQLIVLSSAGSVGAASSADAPDAPGGAPDAPGGARGAPAGAPDAVEAEAGAPDAAEAETGAPDAAEADADAPDATEADQPDATDATEAEHTDEEQLYKRWMSPGFSWASQ